MKKLVLSVCLAMMVFLGCHAQKKAVLEGSVHHWKGDGLLLLFTQGEKGKNDTLQVSADGRFRYETVTDVPVVKVLFLEYLGDDRTLIDCSLLPGKTTRIAVKGEQAGERLKSVPVFSGETQKECEYLQKTTDFWCGFQAEYERKDGGLITFKEYKQQLADYQRMLHKLLKSTDPDFAKEMGKRVDDLTEEVLFPYAWGMRMRQGDASKDADFVAYSNSIDLNDPRNVNLTDHWLRFYRAQHPDTSHTDYLIGFFQLIREKISNQEVRNQLADGRMDAYFGMGGDEALREVFAAYKQTSTNREAIAKFQPLYDRLSKLVPGVPASDFEMQTVDGKTVRFREVIGQGKVTYIDFWATWCGPCCSEIPYVEKLVEKFGATNPDIEFVSISLDQNLNNWLKKLEKDRPAWRQFVIPDNFNSTFAKEYNIRGIPRFMLFDREGKIIDINATRPSSPEIENYLKKYVR